MRPFFATGRVNCSMLHNVVFYEQNLKNLALFWKAFKKRVRVYRSAKLNGQSLACNPLIPFDQSILLKVFRQIEEDSFLGRSACSLWLSLVKAPFSECDPFTMMKCFAAFLPLLNCKIWSLKNSFELWNLTNPTKFIVLYGKIHIRWVCLAVHGKNVLKSKNSISLRNLAKILNLKIFRPLLVKIHSLPFKYMLMGEAKKT